MCLCHFLNWINWWRNACSDSGQHCFMDWVPDWIKWRKQAECLHVATNCSLLLTVNVMWLTASIPANLISLQRWNRTANCEQNLFSLKLLCQEFYHSKWSETKIAGQAHKGRSFVHKGRSSHIGERLTFGCYWGIKLMVWCSPTYQGSSAYLIWLLKSCS